MICFLANLLTHPVYRYARATLFPHEHWVVGMAILEPVVFTLEAGIYAWFLRMPLPRAAAASLIANGASAACGLLPKLLLR